MRGQEEGIFLYSFIGAFQFSHMQINDWGPLGLHAKGLIQYFPNFLCPIITHFTFNKAMFLLLVGNNWHSRHKFGYTVLFKIRSNWSRQWRKHEILCMVMKFIRSLDRLGMCLFDADIPLCLWKPWPTSWLSSFVLNTQLSVIWAHFSHTSDMLIRLKSTQPHSFITGRHSRRNKDILRIWNTDNHFMTSLQIEVKCCSFSLVI